MNKIPSSPGRILTHGQKFANIALQDGLQALTDFTQGRMEVLRLLENLPPEDWNRHARHAIFGPTNLRELVNIIAGHDILHVQQVYKAL